MQKLAVIVKTKTKPGKRDEAYALWEAHLKSRAAANPAQETYFFCYDNDDEDTFHLFEVYNDPSSLAENAQSTWFASYMAEVFPLLDGPPAFSQATPKWIKGVSE